MRSTIDQGFNSEPPNSLQPTRSTLKTVKRLSKDWGPLQNAPDSAMAHQKLILSPHPTEAHSPVGTMTLRSIPRWAISVLSLCSPLT